MIMKRPKIKVRFKYNIDTGEVEEFIIDDNKPDASQEFHDTIANSIAKMISSNPDINDAGNISLSSHHDLINKSIIDQENKQNKSMHIASTID